MFPQIKFPASSKEENGDPYLMAVIVSYFKPWNSAKQQKSLRVQTKVK